MTVIDFYISLLVKNAKPNRSWEIPGGKSENEDCVYRKDGSHLVDIFKVGSRELLEEVGISVEQIGPKNHLYKIYYDSMRETLFLLYNILSHENEPPTFNNTADQAIEKSQWFDIADIDNVDLSFEPDRDFIKNIIFQ